MSGATLDDAVNLAEKGTLFMREGNYADALVTYDKCLSVQLTHLGDLHPMVAHTVDLMGVALLRIGHAEEALETFEKAVCAPPPSYQSDTTRPSPRTNQLRRRCCLKRRRCAPGRVLLWRLRSSGAGRVRGDARRMHTLPASLGAV